jgi:hypothetical protein
MGIFGDQRSAITDLAGAATFAATAGESASISVRPKGSEESEISDDMYLRVFPSSMMIDATATIAGGRIDLNGTLNEVAIERLEAAWPDDWSVDERGAPVRDHALSVEVIERVAVKTQTFRTYDFITKRVVETYAYRWDEVARFTRPLVSGEDGSFGLQFAVNIKHDYEIHVSARDEVGREVTLWVWARGPEAPYERQMNQSLVPYLAPQDCRDTGDSYRVGDPICLLMRNDAAALPTGDSNRYLFFTMQRGLRDVVVQDASQLNALFTADMVPRAEIWAVRFSGTTFTPVENPYHLWLDEEERRLGVRITADQERYEPGDTVTLDVWTSRSAGDPIPAAVVLRAVDEKLFAVGGATDQDPLRDLYDDYVESGLVWTHGSHPLPFARTNDGYGDTTGGGGDERRTFADVVLFRKVTTNANGHARVRFKLSDDLTSWHISATAATAVPEAGAGSILIPVGLPFFVDATLAPEYLAGERPTLRVRAYGSDLVPGDRVTYTITSSSLGMTPTTIRGAAFKDVAVALPVLSAGNHVVTIAGSVQRGAAKLSDRLSRQLVVIDSRLTTTQTSYAPLTSTLRPDGGSGWTTYVFSDAGRGRYLNLLQSLSWSDGVRLDQALSTAIARDLLVRRFGVDREGFPASTFEPGLYQRSDGVALLPYSSADLGQTARVALLAGDRFDRPGLAYVLHSIRDDPTSTRERRNLALAGLAGLGEPVLGELRLAIADADLTIRERLYLALGAAVIGDEATAQAIERDLLSRNGERRGASIRLRVGTSLDDTIEGTALMALVAAQLGEAFAPELQAYVEANRAVDELFNLQQVAFVVRMLDRTPAAAASFAYTLSGKRTIVDLGPGESFSLALLPVQRKSFSLEPLSGSVNVATTWQAPRAMGAVVLDPDLTLTRTMRPMGKGPSPSFFEVRLSATFGPQVEQDCHVVTDLIPSGLAAIWQLPIRANDNGVTEFVGPFDMQAQRVTFCVGPGKTRTVQMRYFARVVSPGEYLWEPAVIQSNRASESMNLTSVNRVTIH